MEDSNEEIQKYSNLIRRNITPLIIIISLSLGVSVLVALLTPNVFKSTAIVVPSFSKYSSSSNSMPSQLGGLASLAGISVNAEVDKGAIAFKTLTSYNFFEILYEDDDFIKRVVAGTHTNLEDGSIDKFNPKFVDPNTKTWIAKPSLEKAYKIFYTKHFSSFKDRKTGFIYLHGDHRIPLVAQEVVENVVKELNDYIRAIDVKEAKAALEYMEGKIASTINIEVKKVLASLAARELQIIALSEASEDFAFKVVQSAYLPETKDSPHRAQMVLAGGLIGIILSSLLILLADFFNLKISLNRSFPFIFTKAR